MNKKGLFYHRMSLFFWRETSDREALPRFHSDSCRPCPPQIIVEDFLLFSITFSQLPSNKNSSKTAFHRLLPPFCILLSVIMSSIKTPADICPWQRSLYVFPRRQRCSPFPGAHRAYRSNEAIDTHPHKQIYYFRKALLCLFPIPQKRPILWTLQSS